MCARKRTEFRGSRRKNYNLMRDEFLSLFFFLNRNYLEEDPFCVIGQDRKGVGGGVVWDGCGKVYFCD